MEMRLLVFATVAVFCISGDFSEASKSNYGTADPLYQRMAGFVLPLGYPLEQHFATTPDGYILRLFRIPHGRRSAPSDPHTPSNTDQSSTDSANKNANTGTAPSAAAAVAGSDQGREGRASDHKGAKGVVARPVVYMQHALIDSSVDYVFLGLGRGLAFLLADAGYDIWMGNVRGNTFSRNHTRLNPDKQEEFWNFSFDEHALVDLPALVDHMTMHTGVQTFAYVGYSQGTMMAFAALSTLPELASRISVAVLMAPLAFITHSTALGVQLAAHADTDKIYQLLGIGEWLGHSSILSLLLSSVCRLEPTPCILAMGAIGGFNPSNIDPAILPLLFQYLPAGTSVQNAAHWSQAVRASNDSRLVRYDFGSECENPLTREPQRCNQKAYGQMEPPEYPLGDITTKLALFTGGQDMLADPQDTGLLLKALADSSVVLVHNEPSYSHWDFGFGSNAHELIFPKIIQIIQNHTVLPPIVVGAKGLQTSVNNKAQELLPLEAKMSLRGSKQASSLDELRAKA